MTVSQFSEALGGIHERYVSEAIGFHKKRRHWPKWMAAVACFAILFTLFVSLFHQPKETLPQYGARPLIPADVTEITVTHLVVGQPVEYHFTGAELDSLRTWAGGLDYTLMDTPEENWYGAEVYIFAYDGQTGSFSYIGASDIDWFLVIDGNWYVVSNPERPLPDIMDGHQWSPSE